MIARFEADMEERVVVPGSVRSKVLKRLNGEQAIQDDLLVVEEPLEMAVRSEGDLINIGITMRTPGDDRNLVLGFLFSEGVIRSASDIASMMFKREADATLPATRVTISLAGSKSLDTERMRRAFPISAACGACGKTALEALKILREGPLPVTREHLRADVLHGLGDRLFTEQSLFARTGGLHASGRCGLDGEMLDLAEDVGRHNSLDKLVGAALEAGEMDWSQRVLVLSGRVGYDLMQKAIMVGCPIVASIGAPSSLAVELASLCRITLIGFLRDTRFNVYAMPERIAF